MIERCYCWRCRRSTTWQHAGSENGSKPRVEMWRCTSCSRVRIAYADVSDSEALCHTVLERHLKTIGSDGAGEKEEMLAGLYAELWSIYLTWDPSRGVSFTAYGTGLLRRRVSNYWRERGGREGNKPLWLAESLDADPSLGGSVGLALSERESHPPRGSHPDLQRAVDRADCGAARVFPKGRAARAAEAQG